MNGKIKIYSKANMLGQYLKMALVLVISVFFAVLLNNTFLLGELISELLDGNRYFVKAVRIAFFVILGVLSYIALLPLSVGRDVWFYENSKKNRLGVRKLFSYYSPKKSPAAVRLMILIHIKKLLITLLFLIPAATIGTYLVMSLGEGIGRKLIVTLAVSFVLLLLSGLFFSFIFSQRYFLAPYLFYENEPCRVRDIVSLSAKIMENRCFQTAFLRLSFVPWMLLYVLLFPAVYVYPYYKLSLSFKAITILNNT